MAFAGQSCQVQPAVIFASSNRAAEEWLTESPVRMPNGSLLGELERHELLRVQPP